MPDFNLQEELLSLTSDPTLYQIPNELDVSSLSESRLDSHLSSAIDQIVTDSESILHSQSETLDVFRSILKHADSPVVSAGILTKTLDAITSSLNSHAASVLTMVNAGAGGMGGWNTDDMDAPLVHKSPLEIWAFLLQWFITIAERGAGKSSEDSRPAAAGRGKKKAKSTSAVITFTWTDHLPMVLTTMSKVLRIPSSRFWPTSSEKEAFVGCFTKPAYLLTETEANLKPQDVRLGIYKVICLSVKFHGHAFGAQTSIIQSLTYFEHLSEPMAELLAILEKEFDYGQLGEEVLRDVAGKTFAHNDVKGPRSFSRFLVRLAELSPRVVQKQMPLLLAHLDSEVRLPNTS